MHEIALVLLTVAGFIGLGYLLSEVAFRIAFWGIVRREKKAAKEAEAKRPVYTVLDEHFVMLLQTRNADEALAKSIGVQGASVWKNDEKILQNRTLVQAGGKK